MRRLLLLLSAAMAAGGPSAFAQAVNAASYSYPGLPNYGVAQGSMFVIFGSGLGPSTLVQASSLPLKTSLGGTSVRVAIGAATVDCFMIYSYSTQIAAILPSGTPVGTGVAGVTVNGRTVGTTSITVVSNAFGVFSRNQAGYGQGIIQNIDSATSVTLNQFNHPAKPGQTIVLWGTGLGPTTGSDSDTPTVGDLNVDVTVLVGGESATVVYKGRSASYPGLDQINVTLPKDVITGCRVPIVVVANSIIGNYTSLAISSDGSTCSDQASESVADIETMVKNGSRRIGLIGLSRLYFTGRAQTDTFVDDAEADFRKDSSELALSSGGIWYRLPAPGTCTAVTFPYTNSNLNALDPGDPGTFSYLNAGPAIAISGPLGSGQLPLQSWGAYLGTLGGVLANGAVKRFFEPGLFVATGSHGTDVPSFQASLLLPSTVAWTNAQFIPTLPRSSTVTVNWAGGDPTTELVIIRGASTLNAASVRGAFTCVASSAANGTFTVPLEILGALPPTDVSPLLCGYNAGCGGLLEIGTTTRVDKARFTTPSSLDVGYIQARRTIRIPAFYP